MRLLMGFSKIYGLPNLFCSGGALEPKNRLEHECTHHDGLYCKYINAFEFFENSFGSRTAMAPIHNVFGFIIQPFNFGSQNREKLSRSQMGQFEKSANQMLVPRPCSIIIPKLITLALDLNLAAPRCTPPLKKQKSSYLQSLW